MVVQVDGREVQWAKSLEGTPAEREEAGHAMGKEVGRMISEAALNEAAKDVRHPSCCGRRMEKRGRRAITVQGLDGRLRIRRTWYRCRTCGRHRLTQPLAKRVCQLATVEHFTRLPQWMFDQHGVADRRRHDRIDRQTTGGPAAERPRHALERAQCPGRHHPESQ